MPEHVPPQHVLPRQAAPEPVVSALVAPATVASQATLQRAAGQPIPATPTTARTGAPQPISQLPVAQQAVLPQPVVQRAIAPAPSGVDSTRATLGSDDVTVLPLIHFAAAEQATTATVDPAQPPAVARPIDHTPPLDTQAPAQMIPLPVQRTQLPVQRTHLPVQRTHLPVQLAQAPMQRAPEVPYSVPTPAGPSVQRVEAVPEVQYVQRVEAQVPAASAGETKPAAERVEPEELLKTLFDPLLRRLKAELRLDRERHGSTTNLRH
jgi:hypothetical protein